LVRHGAPDALPFVRVGRFVESRGPTLRDAVRRLGLRRIVLPRGGYRYAAGFPVSLMGIFLERAVSAGLIMGLVPGSGGVAAVVR
jgi:hypothetical protein